METLIRLIDTLALSFFLRAIEGERKSSIWAPCRSIGGKIQGRRRQLVSQKRTDYYESVASCSNLSLFFIGGPLFVPISLVVGPIFAAVRHRGQFGADTTPSLHGVKQTLSSGTYTTCLACGRPRMIDYSFTSVSKMWWWNKRQIFEGIMIMPDKD